MRLGGSSAGDEMVNIAPALAALAGAVPRSHGSPA